MGLVVRSCHFDVTACAEARRLDNHFHFLKDNLPPGVFTEGRTVYHITLHDYNHFHFLKNCLPVGVFPEGRIGNVELTGGNLTLLPDTKIPMMMMTMI